jgi:dUTP pyrophosphatase
MLNRQDILELIQKNSLIQDYIDLETQLTPNGFDLTAAAIFKFDTAGALDFSNKERVLSVASEIMPQKENPKDKFGWWHLQKGVYKVKTNETVNLPNDLVALAFPRTSLLRMGGFTHHGVWDAGFIGRGEFILAVENPHGIKLKQNARVAQLIFLPIAETAQGYRGIYQNHK